MFTLARMLFSPIESSGRQAAELCKLTRMEEHERNQQKENLECIALAYKTDLFGDCN